MTTASPPGWARWAPIGLFLFGLTVGALFFEPELSSWGDNARHVVLANSLADGRGMREINHPAAPLHMITPPGLPLMLAPLVAVDGDGILAMKLLVLLLFAASGPLLFWLAKDRLGDRWALVAAVTLLTNASAIHFSHLIMQEVPYIFFTLGAALLFQRSEAARGTAAALLLTAAALVAVWSNEVRTVGVSLLVGMAMCLLVNRRWRRLLGFLVVSFAARTGAGLLSSGDSLSIVQFLFQVDPYNPEYGSLTLSQLAYQSARDFWLYLTDVLPQVVLGSDLGWAGALVVLVPLTIGLLGGLRRREMAVFYFGGFLSLLALWPSVWRVNRLILPLLPFILLYLFGGLRWLQKRLGRWLPAGRRINVALVAGFAAAVIACNLGAAVQRATKAPDQRWVNYYGVSTWLGKNVTGNAVVMCRKPYLTYLLSNLNTVRIPAVADAEEFDAYLQQVGVTHVVVDTLGLGTTDEYLVPHLVTHLEAFRPLIQTEWPAVTAFQRLGSAH